MERLTEKKTINGTEYVLVKGCSSLYKNAERKGAHLHNAIVRLAHYEDLEEQGNAKPLTNADRIRAMTDEELARVIADNASTGVCNDFGIPHERCGGNCYECALDWLKDEAALVASWKEGE